MPRSTSRSGITLGIMPPTKARRSWSSTRLRVNRLRRKPLPEIRLSTHKWPRQGAIFFNVGEAWFHPKLERDSNKQPGSHFLFFCPTFFPYTAKRLLNQEIG